MRPPSRRLLNGDGSLFESGVMVCHCLLVETASGLVLVDSGFGTEDVQDPVAGFGRRFLWLTRPQFDPAHTAIRQIERLGYRPEDVRHIVATHLDIDHASGLRDFPWARVHVHAAEQTAALHPTTMKDRFRYRPHVWARGMKWSTYQEVGDAWYGFDAVRELDGLPPEILLVPLAGHTKGHSGVAVDTGEGWLFQVGDAYYFHDELHPTRPRSTPSLRVFELLVQTDGAARRHNLSRLRELRAEHGATVDVFSAHDHVELERFEGSD